MTHQDWNNEATFDRLVDGELSADERRRLLAALDEQEGGWRKCALAFLEAQTWGQQLKQVAAEPESTAVAKATRPAANRPLFSLAYWPAVAAGLLVAFVAGRAIRSPDAADSPTVEIVHSDPQEIVPLDELNEEALADADVVTLLVRDASGENRRLRLPLLEAGDLEDELSGTVAAFPPEIRRSLNDRGFDLQQRRRYAPLFFEQHDRLVPMVVPVEDTNIVPVSRPVY